MSEITRNTQKLDRLKYDCARHPNKEMNYICLLSNCLTQGMNCYLCIHENHKDHKNYCISLDKFLKSLYTSRRILKKSILKKYIENTDTLESQMALSLIKISNDFSETLKTIRQFIANDHQKIKCGIMESFKAFDALYKGCINSRNSKSLFTGYLHNIIEHAQINTEGELQISFFGDITERKAQFLQESLGKLSLRINQFADNVKNECEVLVRNGKNPLSNYRNSIESQYNFPISNEIMLIIEELNLMEFEKNPINGQFDIFDKIYSIKKLRTFYSKSINDYLKPKKIKKDDIIESCKLVSLIVFKSSIECLEIEFDYILKVAQKLSFQIAALYFKFQGFRLGKIDASFDKDIESEIEYLIMGSIDSFENNKVVINLAIFEDNQQILTSNFTYLKESHISSKIESTLLKLKNFFLENE